MSQQQTIIIDNQSTSGIATAGLTFSILGWFTCGLLCIPGAFLSFLGLFSKGPKGTAIAGLIVGFPGVFFFMFFGLSMLAGMLGLSGAIDAAAVDVAAKTNKVKSVQLPPQDNAPVQLSDEDLELKIELGTLVDPEVVLQQIQPDTPVQPEVSAKDILRKAKTRVWTSVDGKFSIEATFVKSNPIQVTLEKTDGSMIDVPLEKLSNEDKKFIKNREWK